MNIDYDAAREILTTEYQAAEEMFRDGRKIELPNSVQEAIAGVFQSQTQAYREAIVGCALARIQNQEIDLRLPYVNQGPKAFNGRTLDERVVNPFLDEHQIPCSRAPYLSALRRGFRFQEDWPGQRDRRGLRAAIQFIEELESANEKTARTYLRGLMLAFVRLRDASDVALSDVNRLSVQQYEALIDGLLAHRSGGLLPVLLAVAMFKTMSECLELNWRVDWQGINVADRARGVPGDINVYRNGKLLFSVEVTEREIDRARVIATFQGKIAPNGLEEYLFLFSSREPSGDAKETAAQFFAQGHEVNFAALKDWLLTNLKTVGFRGRRSFTLNLKQLIGDRSTPAAIKVAWNGLINNVIAG